MVAPRFPDHSPFTLTFSNVFEKLDIHVNSWEEALQWKRIANWYS